MKVMALDLECNQPSGTIIQIGIVIGDPKTGAILEKKCWNIFTEEIISEFIIKLTGITQEMVDNGVFLHDAYIEMTELYKKHNCTMNFVTWGGGDHWALRKQLKDHCDLNRLDKIVWEYGHREFDVKTLFLAFAMVADKKVRSGLAKSLTRIGKAFKGTKHWAPDDSENTFIMLVDLLERISAEDAFLLMNSLLKYLPKDAIIK